jgi:hypothetical protein
MYKIQPRGAGAPKRAANVPKMPPGRMTRAGSRSEAELIGNASHPGQFIPMYKIQIPVRGVWKTWPPPLQSPAPLGRKALECLLSRTRLWNMTDVSTVTSERCEIETEVEVYGCGSQVDLLFFKRASQSRFKTSIIEPSL